MHSIETDKVRNVVGFRRQCNKHTTTQATFLTNNTLARLASAETETFLEAASLETDLAFTTLSWAGADPSHGQTGQEGQPRAPQSNNR